MASKDKDSDWKKCADWLVRCQILPADHPAAQPTAQLQDLAYVLRDGVLVCNLLNLLHPGAVDAKNFSQRPQTSLFLCTKNVKVFLQACKTVFGVSQSDLFEPFDLLETSGFDNVVRTLSKLSQTPLARATNITPFSISAKSEECPDYANLKSLNLKSRQPDDIYESHYTKIYDKEDSKVYVSLIDLQRPKVPVQDRKSKSIQDCCMKELIDTEVKYVDALKMIKEKFMVPLKSVMSPHDFAVVFQDIEQLYAIHSQFVQDLKKSKANESTYTIADCFIMSKEKFLIYGNFCSNLPKAQDVLDKVCQSSSKIQQRVTDCQMAASVGQFKLRDLLVLPMQRVLKYHLILKELIKNTESDEREKKSLQIALKETEDLSLFVNEVKRDNEILNAISMLEKSVSGLPVRDGTSLKDYGRLLMDGELKVTYDKKTSARHVFLLDKLILICKEHGETCKFLAYLGLVDYVLDETLVDGKVAFGFTLRERASKNGAYVFLAKNPELRDQWIRGIEMAKDNIAPRFAKAGNHDFAMATFDKPTICDVCRKLLRGVFFQGYRCRKTNLAAHKECLEKAKDISGPPPSADNLPRRTSVDFTGAGKPSRSVSVPEPSTPPHKTQRSASLSPDTAQPFTSKRDSSNEYVNQLTSYPWYAGSMDRAEAEKVLRTMANGAFLIRVSLTRKGELSLSVKFNENVFHTMIQKMPDGRVFFAKSRPFESVVDLVHFHEKNSLEKYFPELSTVLATPYRDVGPRSPPETMKQPVTPGFCYALYDYAATSPIQISLKQGDRIEIISKAGEDSGWWKGKNGSQVGYFPYAYVSDEPF